MCAWKSRITASDIAALYRGFGWGGRIRTCECRYQKPVPYHLATPQQARPHVCGRGRAYNQGGREGKPPCGPPFADWSKPYSAPPRLRLAFQADSALGGCSMKRVALL